MAGKRGMFTHKKQTHWDGTESTDIIVKMGKILMVKSLVNFEMIWDQHIETFVLATVNDGFLGALFFKKKILFGVRAATEQIFGKLNARNMFPCTLFGHHPTIPKSSQQFHFHFLASCLSKSKSSQEAYKVVTYEPII